MVPLDQYSSPKRIIQLSESSGEDEGLACSTVTKDDEKDDADDDDDDDDVEDGDHNLENSISLDLISNGRHDHHEELTVDNGNDFATSTTTTNTTTTTTQTGDSNGCDLFSDSMDNDRVRANVLTMFVSEPTNQCVVSLQNNYNQGNEINHNPTPKEQLDDSSHLRAVITEVHRVSSQSVALVNGTAASYSKLKSSNPMDESIVIQPQFQQLEINGKSSGENGTQHQSQNHQPQSQHQQQQPTSSHYQPQNQRRRRNSSNSKNDMSPNKPTNGRCVNVRVLEKRSPSLTASPFTFSISPSATNSRFSTPGARSLPLTPPSVPFSIQSPPAAALSCPDGLAHALSEQNLRLQQIVYENRVGIAKSQTKSSNCFSNSPFFFLLATGRSPAA